MHSTRLCLVIVCVLLPGIHLASAAQYCTPNIGDTKHCDYGCCHQDDYDPCCDDSIVIVTVIIVCSVVGGLICICFMVACICCCISMARSRRKGNTIAGQQQHIIYSSVQHQPTVYPQPNSVMYPQSSLDDSALTDPPPPYHTVVPGYQSNHQGYGNSGLHSVATGTQITTKDEQQCKTINDIGSNIEKDRIVWSSTV